MAKRRNRELQNVMQMVVRVVNFTVSQPFNNRHFRRLLEKCETEYGNMVTHNEVRWLSRGKVQERFFSLLSQVHEFLVSKGKNEPDLENSQWIMRLALLSDVTCHLNSLNLKL